MIRRKSVFFTTFLIAIFWGTGFPVSKIAIEQLGVWPFRFYSAMLSVIVLLIFVLATNQNKPSIRDLLACIPLGILNMFLVPILNNIALSYTDSAKASVLIYTMPAITSFLLMTNNRKIDLKSLFVSICCLFGVFIFISPNHFRIGEVVILLSALAWSIGTILSEKFPTKLDMSSKVLYQSIVSFILIISVTPVVSSKVDFFAFHGEFYVVLLRVILPILYIGIVNGAVVYILWFYMVKHGGAELTSYSSLFSPVLSVFISYYFLDEVITTNMIVGMFFILVSVFIVFSRKNKKTK